MALGILLECFCSIESDSEKANHCVRALSKPYSEGPLELPFQRPDPRCRTFHSDAIERVIKDVTSRMKDKDLARLFENAFPVS
jgi:hypothetical protein